MDLLLGYLFIFFARATDVSLATIRTIMVVRGKKLMAACIGFVEVTIYILAINKVLSGMDNLFNVFMYSLGFAAGNYIGVIFEEKMAIGTIVAQVVTKKDQEFEISNYLREKGYGVTITEGKGKEGEIDILKIVLDRKNLKSFEKDIMRFDDRAFITITDVRDIRGGYFQTRTSRSKRK